MDAEAGFSVTLAGQTYDLTTFNQDESGRTDYSLEGQDYYDLIEYSATLAGISALALSENVFAIGTTFRQEAKFFDMVPINEFPRFIYNGSDIIYHLDQIAIIDTETQSVLFQGTGFVDFYINSQFFNIVVENFTITSAFEVTPEGLVLNDESYAWAEIGLPDDFVPQSDGTGDSIPLVETGGSGGDVLEGTEGDDILSGEDGADTLIGLAGNDLLDGGSGNDSLVAGQGENTLIGGFGDDTLVSSQGGDTLIGGDGNNTYVLEGAGTEIEDERWWDDAKSEVIVSQDFDGQTAWVDTITAASDDDLVLGGNFLDNKITGGAGDDLLLGRAGDDTLDGGAGADTLAGGAGSDTYILGEGDVIEGERWWQLGTDVVRTTGDFDARTAWVERVNIQGDENAEVTGNFLDNFFHGGFGENTLLGRGGDDTLLGRGEDDLLMGGLGDDLIIGANGNDSLHGGAGDDTLDGGNGLNQFIGDIDIPYAGIDTLTGGQGADVFRLTAGAGSPITGQPQSVSTVTDFQRGTDLVELTYQDIPQDDAVQPTEVVVDGEDLVIWLGTVNSMVLTGVVDENDENADEAEDFNDIFL